MQVPATVAVVIAAPADEVVPEPAEGVGLGVAADEGAIPGLALGVALALASGAGIEVGAVVQVLTSVVTGTGFGVGVMLPIGAAVPPVDSAGPADGAAEVVGAWLGFVIGDSLGFAGVVRLGGVMLL